MQTDTNKGIGSVEMAEALEQNIYKVFFEKYDGSLRKMRCTRMIDYIPVDKRPKKSNQVIESDTSVSAFDLDKGEWRSIRSAGVISFEIV